MLWRTLLAIGKQFYNSFGSDSSGMIRPTPSFEMLPDVKEAIAYPLWSMGMKGPGNGECRCGCFAGSLSFSLRPIPIIAHCGMDAGNECLDPLVRAFADEAQKAYTEGNLVATSPLSLPIPLSLSLFLSLSPLPLSLSLYVSLSLYIYIYVSLSLSRSLSFFDKLGRANSLIRFAPVLIRVSWPTVQYVTFISTSPMYIYIVDIVPTMNPLDRYCLVWPQWKCDPAVRLHWSGGRHAVPRTPLCSTSPLHSQGHLPVVHVYEGPGWRSFG